MRRRRARRWAMATAGTLALAAACGSRGGSSSTPPGGSGSVFGAVQDRAFDFSASQVWVFAAPAAGSTVVDVYLCEAGCDPVNLALAPNTRAVVLTVNVPERAPGGLASYAIGQQARGLAVWRRNLDAASSQGGPETVYAVATGGAVVLGTAQLAQGGRVAGQLDLQFAGGGVLHGTFDGRLAGTLPDGGTPDTGSPDGGAPDAGDGGT